MNVEIIKPCGFCFGVKKAIELAKQAKIENPNEQVYILGNLVHNESIKEELSIFGLVTLDEKEKTIEEWLELLPNESIIVFTAHGHSPKLTKLALSKRMKIYDATCVFVKENEKKIIEEISNGKDVIYIGEKNHAESNGVIGIDSKKIHLLTIEDDLYPKTINSQKPFIISQTTMSPDDIERCMDKILPYFPDSKIYQGRCYATKERQEALTKADKNIDCFIILGSKTSNNTNKLSTIAKKYHQNATVLQVLNKKELEKHVDQLKTFNEIRLVSGASTPENTILECLNYIKSL